MLEAYWENMVVEPRPVEDSCYRWVLTDFRMKKAKPNSIRNNNPMYKYINLAKHIRHTKHTLTTTSAINDPYTMGRRHSLSVYMVICLSSADENFGA